MPDASTFNCPKCGASLTATGNASEMQCPYCGNTVIVPQELRSTPVSSFEMPQITLVEDQAAGTVGKAVAATVGISLALPILIGVITLCIIGATFYFVSQTISQSFSGITQFANPTNIVALVTAIPVSTDVPEATAAPRPTRAPTSTRFPTPVPAATPTPYTKVLQKDDFSNPSSGWSRENSSDYLVDYVQGGYRMLIKSGGGKFAWTDAVYTNSSVELDVKKLAGPTDAWFGVSCRMKDGVGGYAFQINMDGNYAINAWTFGTSDDYNTLTQGTLDSSLLKPDGTNHIRAACNHGTLSLFVNDQFISQTAGGSYTSGGVGFFILTGDSNENGADYLYSNFVVKGP